MRVTTSQHYKKLHIKFQHLHDHEIENISREDWCKKHNVQPIGEKYPNSPKRATRCVIFTDKEGQPAEVLAEGMSSCNPRDTFHKHIGRKIALQNAFKKVLFFNKEQRKEIWKQVLENKKEIQK